MKIRYIDLFIYYRFLNKYSSYCTKNTYQVRNLIYFFQLDKALNSRSTKSEVSVSNQSGYIYRIFKFSIFFFIFNFLSIVKCNKLKLIFYYVYYYELYKYISSFFTLYWELLQLGENVLLVNNGSIKYLEFASSYRYMSNNDTLNFILRNNIKFVLNINKSLPNVFLHRISEFDVRIVNIFFTDSSLQYLFLNFLYYLKEYSIYNKMLSLV